MSFSWECRTDLWVSLQWEALALLLIGISVNQLRSLPEGTSAMGLPVATGAYIYTLIFVSEFKYHNAEDSNYFLFNGMKCWL